MPAFDSRALARGGVRAAAARTAACVAVVALALAAACGGPPARGPRHFLVLTHPALNRVTFFDLDAHRVVGALPAQKLPHDMLLSADLDSLDVFCSGAQNVTVYHLDSPELWRRAREFMRRDTARAGVAMSSASHEEAAATQPPPRGWAASGASGGRVILNPDPVQELPASVAGFHLTDPTFPGAPDSIVRAHARVHAMAHRACFDCHAGSHGGKPFGPSFTADRRSIELVHLAYRNIAVLDARTFAVRRRIPLDVPAEYAPVEIWHPPGTDTAFVTCRYLIGQSRPGRILVVDLRTGRTVKSIEAGIYPWHMLPDPARGLLYVNNFQSSRISVVDVARERIVDSIVVQNGPSTMCWSPSGDRLLVSCFYTHRLLVVNPATRAVESVIPVGANPTSILFLANRRQALVLCGGESDIECVDLRTCGIVDRWPVLFGAYAFQLVDRDRSGRWVGATGPVTEPHATGARP